MTVAKKISNHSELAYDRLLGQFKDKPIIKAVLETWTDLLQEVEDDLYSLMADTLFLNGEGLNLERYGQLLNIYLPEGMSDDEYRELLIAEIMRRSSDGTPDKIRQIIESTTGIYNTKFFEHYNVKQLPHVMGCNLMFGYGEDNTANFSLGYETGEAKYLKWASPVTTGSCVLGLHTEAPSSLFIPSEIGSLSESLGVTSNKTLNPSFVDGLDDWTYTSDKISWGGTSEDLKMDTLTTSEQPQVTTKLTNLELGRTYSVSVNYYNSLGLLGKLMIGSTPYGNDIIDVSSVTGDENILGEVTVTDINNTYVTLEGNLGADTGYIALWDNVEVYDNELFYDQDNLVNEVDDHIAVRGQSSALTSITSAFGSAMFAEISDENLVIFNIEHNEELESFLFEETQAGIKSDLYVQAQSELKPSRDNGIFLEISQVLYNE